MGEKVGPSTPALNLPPLTTLPLTLTRRNNLQLKRCDEPPINNSGANPPVLTAFRSNSSERQTLELSVRRAGVEVGVGRGSVANAYENTESGGVSLQVMILLPRPMP